MADLADVGNALVGLIDSALYPNGDSNPSAIGIDAHIFVGWPDPAQLDFDANAIPPKANISVYPRPEEHNRFRYQETWQELSRNTATVTLTAGGANPPTFTVGGAVPNPITSNPQNVVAFVNGRPYVYGVQQADTPASIAAALAALIVAQVPGTSSSGAQVTLPAMARLGALRVGVTGIAVEEIGRTEKLFQIGIWAAAPQARDKLAAFVDVLLRGTRWLVMPDQSAARLIYVRSLQSDALQKQHVYRRDLFYTVEYATLATDVETEITQTVLDVSAEIDSVPPATPVATIYS